jgi:low affinity Fe/Cu permease
MRGSNTSEPSEGTTGASATVLERDSARTSAAPSAGTTAIERAEMIGRAAARSTTAGSEESPEIGIFPIDRAGRSAMRSDATTSEASALRRHITRYGVLVAHPIAFSVVLCYGILWWIFDRDTLDWEAVATLAIWFMALFIQRVWHRDTQAIQAKLDELLRVQTEARNELMRIDEKEPEEIERHRAETQRRD